MGRCGLCETERPTPNRLGGLALCTLCFEGGAAERVAARGWQIGIRTSWVRTRYGELHIVKGNARTGEPGLVPLTVRRSTGLWPIWGLLRGLRVSDPLFRKVGVAFSSSPDTAQRFLDDDAAQSSVMDLLGEGISFRVEPRGEVSLWGQRTTDAYDEIAIERELAVLLAHLVTHARVGGGAP